MFEIRKNLDLRKILATPKIFLKSRFHCTVIWLMCFLGLFFHLGNFLPIFGSKNAVIK